MQEGDRNRKSQPTASGVKTVFLFKKEVRNNSYWTENRFKALTVVNMSREELIRMKWTANSTSIKLKWKKHMRERFEI